MKKIIGLLLVLSLFVAGCGSNISQSEYDEVVNENERLQRKVEDLEEYKYDMDMCYDDATIGDYIYFLDLGECAKDVIEGEY